MWEFPKIGDANMVPKVEGSPLIFGNSHVGSLDAST